MEKQNSTVTVQAVNTILSKEAEVLSKFNNTVVEVLRLGFDTERGQQEIYDLVKHVNYALDDLVRLTNNLKNLKGV